MRTAERGFTLLELLVCVALLALAGTAAVGGFAALARNAMPQPGRAAALMVAENVLARARAVTAYVPSAGPDLVTATTVDRSWALVPGTQNFTAGAELRGPGPCGGHAPLLLRLPVSTTYDVAQQTFSVAVGYPGDPCSQRSDRWLTLRQVLPPSLYPPGQALTRNVQVPARM